MTSPYVWTIEFPGVPPGGNTILRMYWAQRYRITSHWRKSTCAALKAAQVPALEMAHITFEVYTKGRQNDADNLALRCKPILDGIVDAGVIKDDSPTYCTVSYRSIQVGKVEEENVIVEISAAKDGGE